MSARSLERAIVATVSFLGPLDEAAIREVLRLVKRRYRPRAVTRAIARAERRGWLAYDPPVRQPAPEAKP